MPDSLNRYATPLIAGLFLVSLISGVALFFHLGSNWFRGMHEWLSMVLIAPFVLHLWKNWRAMVGYFRRTSFAIAMGLSLAAAIAFVIPAGTGGMGGPPQIAFTRSILANSPSKVAPLIGIEPGALVETLKAKGFSAAAPDVALTEIASKSGKDEFALVAALLPSSP